jgi:hypothetical protein
MISKCSKLLDLIENTLKYGLKCIIAKAKVAMPVEGKETN